MTHVCWVANTEWIGDVRLDYRRSHGKSTATTPLLLFEGKSCGGWKSCSTGPRAVWLQTQQGYLQPVLFSILLILGIRQTSALFQTAGQVMLLTLARLQGPEHVQQHKRNRWVKMGVAVISGFPHWQMLTNGKFLGHSQMLEASEGSLKLSARQRHVCSAASTSGT